MSKKLLLIPTLLLSFAFIKLSAGIDDDIKKLEGEIATRLSTPLNKFSDSSTVAREQTTIMVVQSRLDKLERQKMTQEIIAAIDKIGKQIVDLVNQMRGDQIKVKDIKP